jgi:DNA-nicking Smr family endonuclease
MGRDSSKDNDDSELFRNEVEDTTPLASDKVEPWRRRRPPHPLQHEEHHGGRDDEEYGGIYSESGIETPEVLSFCRPGLQKRVFHDLQRGRLEIELELDLHGLTARYARKTLEHFFRDCHRRDIRCVRIIHSTSGCANARMYSPSAPPLQGMGVREPLMS